MCQVGGERFRVRSIIYGYVFPVLIPVYIFRFMNIYSGIKIFYAFLHLPVFYTSAIDGRPFVPLTTMLAGRLMRLVAFTCLPSSTSCFAPTPACFRKSNSRLSTYLAMNYPKLCVFDLDACFWDQEMYEMPAIPDQTVLGDLNGRGKGVIGVMSGQNQISLHQGSLVALQQHADGSYPGMQVAFASSADTPFAVQIGRASLKLLEVIPGLTVWDLVVGRDWNGVDVNQIGRQPPLSSNKSQTHFPRLKDATGIRYDEMLFFDDCN